MYQDPAKIRTHVVKLRFSDEEMRLIQAIVDYTGEQRAVILREWVLSRAGEIVEPSPRPHEGAAEGVLRVAAGT